MADIFAPFADRYAWWHVIGYAYALLVPIWPLRRFGELSHLLILRDAGVKRIAKVGEHHNRALPLLVGIVERTLYVASFLLGSPEFIGVWLALKVAGGWKGWSDGVKVSITPETDTKVPIMGRLFFTTHLIGSGLSVLNALVGALMIQWLVDRFWERALWVAVAASLLTAFVWGWAEREWRRAPLKVNAG